jgi:hypothetical protein
MFKNPFSFEGRVTRLVSNYALLTLLTLVVFYSCSKDKSKSEPEVELAPVGVETSDMFFINAATLTLTGKIINEDKQKIIDHGFLWGYNQAIDMTNSTKISLGGDIVSGFFTATLSDFKPPIVQGVPTPLYIKTYVVDKSGTHYGNYYTKKYDGTLVTGIKPESGKAGDPIVIHGGFKGLKSENVKVTFSSAVAKVTVSNDSTVIAEVPKGIPVGHGESVVVNVQVGSVIATAALNFYVWANITDISPKSGPIGTKLIFTGDNLPLTKDAMPVELDEAGVKNYFDGTYYARVSPSTVSEKAQMYYYQGDKKVPLPWQFTVTPPVVTSISPNPAIFKEKVVIHLDNKDLYLVGTEVYVSIGIVNSYIVPNANGDVIFDPGADLPPGKSYPVSLSYGPHWVYPSPPLEVVPPQFTGFSPQTGYPGTKITFTGKFGKGADYSTSFGEATAVSSTEAELTIGMGIESKAYQLDCQAGGVNIKIPGTFQGKAPEFSSISPSSGKAGSSFTVKGIGYVPDSDNAGTRFAGVSISSTKVTFNEITFKIHELVPAGTYPVNITIGGKEFKTGLSFTVTP